MLHRAARGGNAHFCEYIMTEFDFNVNTKSRDLPGRRGQTALEMAKELERTDVVYLCELYIKRDEEKARAVAPVRMWREAKEKYFGRTQFMLYICPAIWISAYLLSVLVYLFQYVARGSVPVQRPAAAAACARVRLYVGLSCHAGSCPSLQAHSPAHCS